MSFIVWKSRVRCGGSTDKRRLSAGTKMSSSYPHALPPPVFFHTFPLVTKRDRSEVHDKLLWVLVPMVMSHALQTPLLRTYDVYLLSDCKMNSSPSSLMHRSIPKFS